MQKSAAQVDEIVERTLTGLGFEFVEIERLARGLMRVTIDTDREGGVGVDDCETVSDQLTHLFTVEDIDFERLEVASPGVDRPLKRVKDWIRFAGSPVHVELFAPMHAEGFPEAGRRKLDGRILGLEGEPGAETVLFSFEELNIARTPSQAARAKQGKGKKSPAAVDPVTVRFALADVDRANLIAQLDFRGKTR